MLTLLSRDHSHADATHRGIVWCLSLLEETHFQFLFENVQWQTIVEPGWCKLFHIYRKQNSVVRMTTVLWVGGCIQTMQTVTVDDPWQFILGYHACQGLALGGGARISATSIKISSCMASQKVRAVGRRRNRVSVRIKSVLMINLALHVRHRFTSALCACFMLCFVNTCCDQGAETLCTYTYLKHCIYTHRCVIFVKSGLAQTTKS